ncbi:hypothetical protein [Mycoplasma sp. Ms02]|uniref:hypothetical protein n=1 Tax=Mycoplasma sp. Ms02 TaxID=353851 RepID=UPI001C8AB796|nr:hypothetical protein [Mycoplasma sp. Ms02]QZE12515.1 hypothetical protein K4L35_00790 [Mycoplasma sp. Ms02]
MKRVSKLLSIVIATPVALFSFSSSCTNSQNTQNSDVKEILDSLNLNKDQLLTIYNSNYYNVLTKFKNEPKENQVLLSEITNKTVKQVQKDYDLLIKTDFTNIENTKTRKKILQEKFQGVNPFNVIFAFYSIIDNYEKYSTIFPNLIPLNRLRKQSLSNNKEQIYYWEKCMEIYLKSFGFADLNRVEITINENDVNRVLVKLYDINSSLLAPEINLQMPDLFSYKAINPSYKFENESSQLYFDEYLKDAKISVNKSKTNFDWNDFDNFIDNRYIKDNYNALSFANIIKSRKDLLFIEVPKYKKGEDESYVLRLKDNERIENNFWKEDQLGRVIVETEVIITKKDGSIIKLPWLSINFNDHYHLMRKINKKPIDSFNDFIQSRINEMSDDYKQNIIFWSEDIQSQIEAYYIGRNIEFKNPKTLIWFEDFKSTLNNYLLRESLEGYEDIVYYEIKNTEYSDQKLAGKSGKYFFTIKPISSSKAYPEAIFWYGNFKE